MKWLQSAICVLCTLFPLFVDPRFWPDLRTEILVFLSVLLGAVLFRLGRGLPQLEVDSVSLTEVNRLADAYKLVGDRLVWVFAITMAAILFTIVNKPLLAISQEWSWVVRSIGCVTTLVVTLALVRAGAVVLGDRDLIRHQVELLKRAAQKRHADEQAERLDEAERQTPMAPSEGYGGIRRPKK